MAGAADKLELAHLFLWQVLPIGLNGPILFMADTAYNIKRANLFFIAGAANKIDWAHSFYGRCC
jgi:hypothetical protein